MLNLHCSWRSSLETAEGLEERALEERLYGRQAKPGDERPRPDPVVMHRELRRTGVTLELLHLEYSEEHPTGLRYTAFRDVHRRWKAKRPPPATSPPT